MIAEESQKKLQTERQEEALEEHEHTGKVDQFYHLPKGRDSGDGEEYTQGQLEQRHGLALLVALLSRTNDKLNIVSFCKILK